MKGMSEASTGSIGAERRFAVTEVNSITERRTLNQEALRLFALILS